MSLADLQADEGLPDGEYAIWSPFDAYEAALTLMQLLRDTEAPAP